VKEAKRRGAIGSGLHGKDEAERERTATASRPLLARIIG
jgi:hypothetical protein